MAPDRKVSYWHDLYMKEIKENLFLNAAEKTGKIMILMDDWEAFAGKPFTFVNKGFWEKQPNRHAKAMYWFCQHPWVKISKLCDCLDLKDQKIIKYSIPPKDMKMTSYIWLQKSYRKWHTYDAWYYGSFFAQSYFDYIPQDFIGKYSSYIQLKIKGWINQKAPQFIKNLVGTNKKSFFYKIVLKTLNFWNFFIIKDNLIHQLRLKKMGSIHTPHSLLHDLWQDIDNCKNDSLKKLAELAYLSMIYETAWHNVNFYCHGLLDQWFGERADMWWPFRYDKISGWQRFKAAHLRDVNIIMYASQWVKDIQEDRQKTYTVIKYFDIDIDGQEECVLQNNKACIVLDPDSGIIKAGFLFDPSNKKVIQVMGNFIINPSREDDHPNADRQFSLFSQGLPLQNFSFKTLSSNTVQMSNADKTIHKSLQLKDGESRLNITIKGAQEHKTLFAFSPNVYDIFYNGKANITSSLEENKFELKNSQGGFIRLKGQNTTFKNCHHKIIATYVLETEGKEEAHYELEMKV